MTHYGINLIVTDLQREFEIDELSASVIADYVLIRQSRHPDYSGDPINNAEYYTRLMICTEVIPVLEIATFIEENVQRISELTTLPERSLLIGASLLRGN